MFNTQNSKKRIWNQETNLEPRNESGTKKKSLYLEKISCLLPLRICTTENDINWLVTSQPVVWYFCQDGNPYTQIIAWDQKVFL